jgi:hypothetical protein
MTAFGAPQVAFAPVRLSRQIIFIGLAGAAGVAWAGAAASDRAAAS